MQFRTYEKIIVALFVIFAVASSVWWAITGGWLPASTAIASMALVLIFTILFAGSALERRGSRDGVDTFREGSEHALAIVAEVLHFWTHQQAAAQRTQTQLARNDGYMIKAQSRMMEDYVKRAREWADQAVKAQAQATPAEWWEMPDDDEYVDAEFIDPYNDMYGGR